MITWTANYRDGSTLTQYNGDRTTNRYEDIDRWQLVRFDLLKDGVPIASVYLRRGQRLIYRRRTFLKLSGEKNVVYLVGWQQTLDTKKGLKNITALMYVHEDGSIALDGARKNLVLHEEEL